MFGKLFNNLKNGLTKTRNALTDKINEALNLAVTIDDDLYEELEEILIMADIGMDTTMEIIDRLKDKIRKEKINDVELVRPALKEVILEIINDERRIIFALRFRSDCVGNQKVFSSAEKRVKEDSVIVLSCVSVTAAAVILGQVKFFKLRCSREPAFLIETQTANDLVGYSSGK